MSIPSWARVGAKVVCVVSPTKAHERVSFWKQLVLRAAGMPVSGGTYTINYAVEQDDGAWLSLRGFTQLRAIYNVKCFRPLVEPKTEAHDLEFFKHHLTTPVKTDA